MAVNQALPPQTARSWHKRVWSLTWPVILANITIPMVGVADVAVLGQLPEATYIAAVTMGAAMFSAVYWMFGFLRMGTTGLASQAFGRREIDEVVATGIRAGIIALSLGAVILVIQIPLASALFALFDADPDIAQLARDYFAIRVWGAPGLLLNLVQLGILFGLQRMRDTLWLSIGMNITNLVLDVLFVMGFGLDVKGVALGTVISEWSAVLLGFWLVRRALYQSGWQGHFTAFWIPDQIRALFNVSSNLVLRTFFVQLPFFAGTVVATQMGATTLAAHGILMQLFFVMTYALDGFAHTAETLSGYSLGARQPQALKSTTRYCACWGYLIAALNAAVYAFFGQNIIQAFTSNHAVSETAQVYLPWLAVSPLLCLLAFLYDGIFIGTTHIKEMRNAMFVSVLAWALTLWVCLDQYGYHALWISMSVFMVLRSVLLRLYYPRIVEAARP